MQTNLKIINLVVVILSRGISADEDYDHMHAQININSIYYDDHRDRYMNISDIDYPVLNKEELLNFHNLMRRGERAADMIELRWNNNLAEDTLWKIKSCQYTPLTVLIKLNMEIITNTTPHHNLTAVLSKWYNQKLNYDFDKGSCEKDCNSYIAMVTWNMIQLGCAINFCESIRGSEKPIQNSFMFACQYLPFEYIPISTPPHKKGKECSSCPMRFSICTQGLCTGPDSSYPDWVNLFM